MRDFRVRLAAAFGCTLFAGCAPVLKIPGIGSVSRSEICDDSCCGAQGVECLVTADAQDTLPHVPTDKNGKVSVDQFLGRQINRTTPTDINQACGEVRPGEYFKTKDWELSVKENGDFKSSFNAKVSSELRLSLGVSNDPKASAEIEAAVSAANSSLAKFRAAVYTIDKRNVDEVRCRCFETDHKDGQRRDLRFVVSLTVVEASQNARDELIASIASRISASTQLASKVVTGSGELRLTVESAVNRSVSRAIEGFVFPVSFGFYNGERCPSPTAKTAPEMFELYRRLEQAEKGLVDSNARLLQTERNLVESKTRLDLLDASAIRYNDFVQLQNKVEFVDDAGNYPLMCLDRPSIHGIQIWECMGDGTLPWTSGPSQTWRLLKRGPWQRVQH